MSRRRLKSNAKSAAICDTAPPVSRRRRDARREILFPAAAHTYCLPGNGEARPQRPARAPYCFRCVRRKENRRTQRIRPPPKCQASPEYCKIFSRRKQIPRPSSPARPRAGNGGYRQGKSKTTAERKSLSRRGIFPIPKRNGYRPECRRRKSRRQASKDPSPTEGRRPRRIVSPSPFRQRLHLFYADNTRETRTRQERASRFPRPAPSCEAAGRNLSPRTILASAAAQRRRHTKSTARAPGQCKEAPASPMRRPRPAR